MLAGDPQRRFQVMQRARRIGRVAALAPQALDHARLAGDTPLQIGDVAMHGHQRFVGNDHDDTYAQFMAAIGHHDGLTRAEPGARKFCEKFGQISRVLRPIAAPES